MGPWRGSGDKPVVFAVRANPEPVDATHYPNSESTVVQADTNTLEAPIAHGFERHGRVRGISFS